MKVKNKRIHRKIRIRKKISGTSTIPRLAVFKSNSNIYVQAIDDLNQVTLASASTLSKEIKSKTLSNESAQEVGELLGEKLQSLKIKSAVFDRGGYIYHGRVKSLADGIRDKGIEF
ncbi:50S ribosomal protein L18 [Acidimicrobiaceae bacterium]|jgi:large subunit ribosomal protein L18|nr:50S ribosomal protein L18 [Acidimicrobiaceae bacterium]|tara:strand:+ start:2294 stop:2641 length:348 start_codon:yes stop_codon:yes gene_type:complete